MNRQQLVRNAIQIVKSEESRRSGRRIGWNDAVGILARVVDRSTSTVKTWATVEKHKQAHRQISDEFIAKFQTFIRSRYGQVLSDRR
jgi:hypothetical protein